MSAEDGWAFYSARQMAAANQAALEYVCVADGESCFRLLLTPPVCIEPAA